MAEDFSLNASELDALGEINWGDLDNELNRNREMVREATAQENFDVIGVEKTIPGSKQMELDFLLDIPLSLRVEVGRKRMLIEEVLKVSDESIIELNKVIGNPLDIYVNDTLIGEGTIVVENEKYGLRITRIIKESERIDYLQSVAL